MQNFELGANSQRPDNEKMLPLVRRVSYRRTLMRIVDASCSLVGQCHAAPKNSLVSRIVLTGRLSGLSD